MNHTSIRSRLRPVCRAAALALALPLLASGAWAQSIGTLQGTSHISPFNNTSVSNIAGIVTARDNNGFWFQDNGDGNALTSDALYVFLGSAAPKPLVGDDVRVGGRLVEFRPGGDATNLTLTEINATSAFAGSFSVLSSGNALPLARVIDTGFLPPSTIAPSVGNIETAPGYVLNPGLYSMDFYESMEGMRVRMPSAISSGPTDTGTGETALYASALAGAPGTFTSPRGGLVIGPGQFNGQRLIIDNRITATPSVNSGAQLTNVTGVIDYTFNNYKLLVTETPTVVSNSLARETATIAPGRFGLASYNVENLGGNAAATRFTAIAGQLATNVGAPHLISLQEIQDNNGATNDGTVSASTTLGNLASALNSATGRTYAWVSVNPQNNTDGGQPGGNIRQGFMYDTSRVSFAGVVGGALDAVSAVAGAGGQIVLNLGAGRIDPTNAAFANSRKPLVTEFTVDGQQIIVIANHFNSKGGDQPLYGPTQPPVNGTETQRLAQAQAVGSFVAGLLAINPNANIVVTGDLNDFQFASSLAPLAAAGLTNLTNSLPENERYTYSFEGNLQTLDHMWVSSNLLGKGDVAYDVVHANAEFIDQVSDHDPILMTLAMVPAPVPEAGTLAMMLLGLLGVAAAARRR
jgi:uncharacterized protein